MTIIAKPILKDRFWIVEDEGVKVGTISKEDNSYIVSTKGKINVYESELQFNKKFGKNFLTAKITSVNSNELFVHNYPTKSLPYNSMFDISRKLPLFTKSEKSKTVYCAGYYLIKFNVNWLKSFCPKLVTIETNMYLGPFKTELDMKQELNRVSK